MLIERTDNNQITITVSSSVDSFGLQRVIDYLRYLEGQYAKSIVDMLTGDKPKVKKKKMLKAEVKR
jgi:hypothetical protein